MYTHAKKKILQENIFTHLLLDVLEAWRYYDLEYAPDDKTSEKVKKMPQHAVIRRNHRASLDQSWLLIPEDWMDLDADTLDEFCSTIEESLARGGTTTKAATSQLSLKSK